MKKEYIGWAGATCGTEVYVNTIDDEMVTLNIKDRKERWKIYCNHVRITVETLTKDEFKDWKKMMEIKKTSKKTSKKKYGRRD